MPCPLRILELRSVRGTGGGPEKTILRSAALHNPQRVAVTVCYIRDARDDAFDIGERARALGLDYVEVLERHSLDLRAWRELRALVHERRIDIVHAHDYKTDAIALWLALVTDALPLATAHGWSGSSTWKERALYYPADRRLLARFPRVVAVSPDVRDALVASGTKPERVRVLLNGIDADAFRRDAHARQHARDALGVTEHDCLIGTAARLEPVKRLDVLIDAVAAVKPHVPTARLAVAGDGALLAELRLRAEQAGVPAVFTGQLADVRPFVSALDVFVQASDYEGTSNAVLEAMALDTPVVATDAGGTASLVRHGVDGLLVPRRNVAALAGAVLRTLREPDATAARVRSARTRVETDLSFAARTQAIEAVYAELAATR